MKKLLAVLAVLAVVSVSSKAFAADGTINLTNYDSNNPIMYIAAPGSAAVRLPEAGSFVQMLGGPAGGTLVVLSVGQTAGGATQFALTEPGFFDGGFGVVPGVAESGTGSFQIRAWRNAASYDVAVDKGISAIYSNAVGTNPAAPAPPVPAANANAPSFTVTAVPEPSTVLLGLLGAGALLFRRRK